jgi:hypothetical protein
MLETLAEIARIVQGFVSLAVLLGVAIAYVSWKSKQSLERRSAALSFSGTRNREFLEARRLITLRFRDYFASGQSAPATTVKEIVAQEKEISKAIELTLAHWEVMSIAIFDKLIDEKTCFEMTGSLLVRTVNVLEDYIFETRANPPRPRRFDFLLILHSEWKDRLDRISKDGTVSRFDQYKIGGKKVSSVYRQLRSDRDNW